MLTALMIVQQADWMQHNACRQNDSYSSYRTACQALVHPVDGLLARHLCLACRLMHAACRLAACPQCQTRAVLRGLKANMSAVMQ